MAYDPKSYLDKALKEGFTPFYSQPASLETGEAPQYQGDMATFGDIIVRPTTELTGQTEQDIGTARQTGYAVDSPLTGKYQGWTRSDVYDNDGKFVTTAYTPPDKDKYGLKGLAQIGMMAASFGGLGPLAKALSQGIGALQSKNPMALLSAATGVTGTNFVPSAVSDVMKYAGQANQVGKALKGDMGSIFNLITGAASGNMSLPKGLAGNVDLSASDAIEGLFEPGGEGYVDPTAGELPSWALDPYKDETPTFKLPTDEDYEELESIWLRYPEQKELVTEPKTSMSPQEMSRFLEANIDDPVIVDGLMQEYFPDLYRQSINVTGTLPNQESITAPRSIRDIGTVTTISPDEALEGTTIEEPDLSVGLPSVPATKTGGTKAGGTGGTKSGGSKDTKDSGSGLDLGPLFGIMGALANQQQPMRTASPNVARIDTESPFGLMYGLRG